jgi:hypothetical protein
MRNVPKKPELEYLCRLKVKVGAPLAIGDTGEGIREVIPIIGGTVEGPKLNGKIVPGGADWATGFKNGVWRVWARYTIELDDGTLVGITNSGSGQEGADGIFRGFTSPVFEVADGKHAWLRSAACVSVLETDMQAGSVVIDLWQLA